MKTLNASVQVVVPSGGEVTDCAMTLLKVFETLLLEGKMKTLLFKQFGYVRGDKENKLEQAKIPYPRPHLFCVVL